MTGLGDRLHIVWMKTELLHPVDKGGRIRTYNMLRALAERHRVTYVALDDGDAEPDAAARAREYCERLVRVPFRTAAKGTAGFHLDVARALVSRLPYAVRKYRSPEMTEAVRVRCAAGSVDVVVCDFLAPSINVPDGLPCPTVLFQHNVEAAIWARHAAVAPDPLRRALMRAQWRRMRRFEGEQCRRFDHVVAVSEDDRRTMEREYGARHVDTVPTGVDTEYFRPRDAALVDQREIVFVGSMDWLPNEDGIVHFVERVFPLVRAVMPDARLTVVGRRPTARVLSLAERTAGVTVTGSVPDVRPYLARAAAVVVPLRIGGGTRLKIYEAMAMDRPVVSTTIGAEGLPLESGRHLLLADAPSAQADAILGLLADPARAAALGRAGGRYVRESFGWDGVAHRFADICARAGARARHPQPAFVS